MTMTSCQGLVTRWLEDRLRSDDDDTSCTHMKGLEGIPCQRSARLVRVISVFFSALYVYFLGFLLPTSLSLLFPSLLGLCFPSGFWSFVWFFFPQE